MKEKVEIIIISYVSIDVYNTLVLSVSISVFMMSMGSDSD